ncbi:MULTISPECIES: helix-turn-helix domain-containing protein [Bacillaceae]|uniref:Helix-turn-helix transcriptional regulator n=1 Tax=Bacillus salipaludis TaxID=2547811 RepID=A0A4R5VTQ3_9BACI|nr:MULTISPECIES: helix-turn-helix transcriptional regulator [Bacillaceae]MBI0577541.1 helix-turn-helix transcriptional regulator [Neobacillus cucumis]MDQ6600183.1 helix-turn-helix transcriptional regulator [Bacillus salipaludis]MED1468790.1 helix-turn-helix transcriptional regulator [Bacillus salipaludis]TDK62361.1 XRE family transcriptional regulator [Bacillus salipaludis]WHY91071.1 helix-turn-helix transcriptional regulator [Neobacillus cucumis]
MRSIGQIIKNCREMQNMTQQELAQKVRVGLSTIEKYESGEQVPSRQTILKLSTVLDIPASELLDQAFHTQSSTIDQGL